MKTYLISITIFFTCYTAYSQETSIKKSRKKTIKVIEYYENGQLKAKGKKKLQTKLSSTTNGRTNGIMTYFKSGKWIEYYSNGNKKRIIIYDKGDIIKEVKKWNENEIEFDREFDMKK